MLKSKVGPVSIILATILIPGLSSYGVLNAVAAAGDAHQLDTEKTIVQSALDRLDETLRGAIVQDAYWDGAYDHIDAHANAPWVQQQFNPASVGAGVTTALVADQSARTILSVGRAEPSMGASGAAAAPAVKILIARALAAPALPAAAVTGFVVVGHQLYMAAAERIVPNDARAKGPLAKHFALAFLAPLDTSQLTRLETQFHIAPIHLTESPNRGTATIALRDAAGNALDYLSWNAARPGHAFAGAAAPFSFAAFLVAGLLQLIVLRAWMQASQRIRDEGVAKTMFLANVSHELRTPLNAVIGFSECMISELHGPMNPRYKEYASDIRMSGQHLLGIVNDVLDLTHLYSTETIAFEPMSLSEAMVRPLRMLREYARGQDIVVDYADFTGGAIIVANEKAISQILLNLGSNAVKFSPAPGNVEIILTHGQTFAELIVRDRGTGIAPDKLRLIGQPFLQAHNATARKPGSGLGLAIVKTLVDRLGGEFTVDSALGKGTIVTVRLPLYRAHSNGALPRSEERSAVQMRASSR